MLKHAKWYNPVVLIICTIATIVAKISTNNQEWIYVILGCLLVLAIANTLSGLQRDNTVEQILKTLQSNSPLKLVSRQESYVYARQIIDGADVFIKDVTWGKIPNEEPTAPTRVSREAYRDATYNAVSRGKPYQEIYSLHDPSRITRMKETLQCVRDKKLVDYRIKYVADFTAQIPMIDFIVVDDQHVILHLVADANSEKYLVGSNQELARFLSTYFNKVWDSAHMAKLIEDKDTREDKLVDSETEQELRPEKVERSGVANSP